MFFDNLPRDLQELVCLYLPSVDLLEAECLNNNIKIILSQDRFWNQRMKDKIANSREARVISFQEKHYRLEYLQDEARDMICQRKFYEAGRLCYFTCGEEKYWDIIDFEGYLIGLIAGGFDGFARQFYSSYRNDMEKREFSLPQLFFQGSLIRKDLSTIIKTLEEISDRRLEDIFKRDLVSDNIEDSLASLYKEVRIENFRFHSSRTLDSMISLQFNSPDELFEMLYDRSDLSTAHSRVPEFMEYLLKNYKVSPEIRQSIYERVSTSIRRERNNLKNSSFYSPRSELTLNRLEPIQDILMKYLIGH